MSAAQWLLEHRPNYNTRWWDDKGVDWDQPSSDVADKVIEVLVKHLEAEPAPAAAWNSPGVAVSTARVVVRNAGHASGRNLEVALAFLLTRIGSWTDARWDQHLRHEFGDEFAGPVIIALKRLSRLSELE